MNRVGDGVLNFLHLKTPFITSHRENMLNVSANLGELAKKYTPKTLLTGLRAFAILAMFPQFKLINADVSNFIGVGQLIPDGDIPMNDILFISENREILTTVRIVG